MPKENDSLEDKIQKDLDEGKFYQICSNETTFKNYVFKLLKEQKEEIEKKLIHEFTTHQRCTNCGKKKDRYSLSWPQSYWSFI